MDKPNINVESINVAINGEAPKDPIEIILKTGQAAAPIKTREIASVTLTGDIDTPIEVAEKQSDLITPTSVATISRDIKDPNIKIQFSPEKEIGTVVTGKIQINPDLDHFKIGHAGVFTNKDFIHVIQNNAHCFKSIAEAKKLVKSLRSFKAKVETEFTDDDDRKGNSELAIKTKVAKNESGIPEEVVLEMPLIKNGPSKQFTVEVEIDVDGNKIHFGLFSLELTQMIRDAVSESLEEAINKIPKAITRIYSI